MSLRQTVFIAFVAFGAFIASVNFVAASPLETLASGPPAFLTAAASSSPDPFTGTVAEVLDVPGYTYAHVVDDTGQGRWAVTLGKDLAVGTVVDVRPFGALEDFYSKRADRHFDQMIFAILTPGSLR